MKIFACTTVALASLLGSVATAQDDSEPKDPSPQIKKLVAAFKYQKGKVTVGKNLATVDMPADFRFLAPKDAQSMLEKVWGNPPDSSILGLILPADLEPTDPACWAIIVTYDEEGYIKDDDASSLNYDDLLSDMKSDVKDANEEREKAGYEPLELIGWATKPHYDAAEKKLYWAKELKFGDSSDHTLNYNIRILGRKGVLVLNAVADMGDLGAIEAVAPQVLSFVDFSDGNRYEDFNPSIDKVAAYGIGALIAGKVALKVGLIKGFWVAILAAKKIILIGLIAVGAFVAKLFGRRKPAA